jgi:hypothetical protein
MGAKRLFDGNLIRNHQMRSDGSLLRFATTVLYSILGQANGKA